MRQKTESRKLRPHTVEWEYIEFGKYYLVFIGYDAKRNCQKKFKIELDFYFLPHILETIWKMFNRTEYTINSVKTKMRNTNEAN